mmetsp:Transcript_34506/g.58536  ORF Transcript_34506/g.58536 Transcript_34506/m.58536 type:complete len:293 (-) Transcript_34506:292-1170(-)
MHLATEPNSSYGRKDKRSQQSLPSKRQELHQTISAMLHKEQYYACHDYLKHGIMKRAGPVYASRRAKVCRWIFQTVENACMQRETAINAMSYFDRFLWSKSPRATKVQQMRVEKARADQREYQLAAMTSLYIAIKINEPIEMDALTLSKLSRGLQSAKDIISCEQDMLSCLRWKMNGPTSHHFISYIMKLLPHSISLSISLELYANSYRQVELSVQDSVFVPIRRSTVAIAAILNSLNWIESSDFPSDKRTDFLQEIFKSFDLNADDPLLSLVRRRLLHISNDASKYRTPQR